MVASYDVLVLSGVSLPQAYKPMVFSKWLRSLRYGNDYYRIMDSRYYYQYKHRAIEQVLSSPDCVVRVAALTADHDVVLGFSIARSNLLDYVHVQKDYRRQGIARALVPANINTVTEITKSGLSLWTSVIPNATFKGAL